ncbi:MAG: cytochrome c oxidase subunit II [Chloroflexi bacterium]|nr:cytochrome c oxidase subunit II [Chloroflexota bacterium]
MNGIEHSGASVPPMRKHLAIVLPVAAVLSFGLAYLFARIDLIPHPASAERQSIDTMLRVLFAVAGAIFGMIVTVFGYTLAFFRRRAGDDSDSLPLHGFLPAEIAWTAIPLVIVVVISAYGGMVLNKMSRPAALPQTELEVDVQTFRFGWQFSYPQYGGVASSQLGLPVDRRVVFSFESRDVVHGFWVKEWGPKQDAVPGMVTELRITPQEIGRYQVQCSQLCGFGHTYMIAPASVMAAADFETWVKSQKKP